MADVHRRSSALIRTLSFRLISHWLCPRPAALALSSDFDSLISSAHSASDEIYDEIAVYSGLQVLPVYLVVADTSG